MSYDPTTHVVTPILQWLTCDAAGCNRTSPQNKCSKCERAYYCGAACQKKDWKTHKINCIDFRAMFIEFSKQDMPMLSCSWDNDLCITCKRDSKAFVLMTCGHAICYECCPRYDSLKCTECGMEAFDATDGQSTPCECLAARFVDQLNLTERMTTLFLENSSEDDGDADLIRDAKEAVQNSIVAYQMFEEQLASAKQNGSTFYDAVESTKGLAYRLCQLAQFHLLAGNARECIDLNLRALNEIVEVFKQQLDIVYQAKQISNDKYYSMLALLNNGDHKALLDVFSALYPKHDAKVQDDAISLVAKTCFAMGKAFELLSEPESALEWYGRIPSEAHLDASLFHRPDIMALFAKGLAERAQVQHRLGNNETVLDLASTSEKAGVVASSAGAPALLATLLSRQGDLERAKRIMNEGLFREAPWDKLSKLANKMHVVEIYEEERRREELRLLEAAFMERWGETIDSAKANMDAGDISWQSIKDKHLDMFATVDHEYAEVQRQIQTAALNAAHGKFDEESEDLRQISQLSPEMIGDYTGKATRRLDEIVRPDFERIKLTKQVIKWLKGAGRGNDPKLRIIFRQRLRQLAAGDKSRILNKPLMGAKNIRICETYMDGNFRILWTDDTGSKDINLGLVVWFVSAHDNVSRCMKKIEESISRSSRQMGPINTPSLHEFADEDGVDDLQPGDVLLDPESDTPLKLYVVGYNEIPELGQSWYPPLYLTEEERQIVQTKGSVLLLGRSGCGKTICACNRIDFDRHAMAHDVTFKSIFVARSHRICHFVQESVGLLTDGPTNISFSTFEDLLIKCEEQLRITSWPREKRICFPQFKDEFGSFGCGELEPLDVWTNIISFIKGSIQAVMKGGPLSREEYLDTEQIGSRRCRLSMAQRAKVYDIFEKYQTYMNRESMLRWDDCDRAYAIVSGLLRDKNARQALTHRRLYVDEIQDFMQVEIALFVLICEHGGLFLAGDPAQAVVEGVEFRFEEVRSVFWNLLAEEDRSKYIPSKPLTVNRNFRSHKGILNVAGEILDRLFRQFPNSAKELPKDEGLFMGPRPSILQNVRPEDLVKLVRLIDGVVLLASTDEKVAELASLVGRDVAVLSIRDSKGLEFSDVIIVDFFSSLPPMQQKAWKLLTQEHGNVNVERMAGVPELEPFLKQLYTGVTRCTNHLFFAETKVSMAGHAFFRRLTEQISPHLATMQNVDDVQKMTKSPDRWRTQGATFAVTGESENKLEYWMPIALNCFINSGDLALVAKAKLQIESMDFRAMDDTTFGTLGLVGEAFTVHVADLLRRLVHEGLMLEARKVYERVFPLFDDYTREHLESRLAKSLPRLDVY
ncbi:hypothetical protein MPSEU_000876400 [Mayamaea pseudoterrestris]|nr:hypothetical protein MPSEU_000876400 [Mayamaea pseudoterrestris]